MYMTSRETNCQDSMGLFAVWIYGSQCALRYYVLLAIEKKGVV